VKFNIGDSVKVVKSYSLDAVYKVGNTGTIVKLYESHLPYPYGVIVDGFDESNDETLFLEDELELVDE
jgi:hypothetical protein